MARSLLVDCEKCVARVSTRVLAEYTVSNENGVWVITFMRCPQCDTPLVASEEAVGGDELDEPIMVYPETETVADKNFPDAVSKAYAEALLCMRAKAYTASAIMCRKCLEAMSKEHKVKARNLANGLKELEASGVIDGRLLEWADALRISGNEAVHDVNLDISPKDARDVLELTEALLQYVFTFRDRFDEFMKRRKSRSQP